VGNSAISQIEMKSEMKNLLIPILILFCIIGCENKTVEKDGGLVIDLKFVDESLSDEQKKTALDIVQHRATSLSKATPNISLSGNSMKLELPAEYDSILYKKMLLLKGEFEINKTYVLLDLFENLARINETVDIQDSTALFSLLSLNVNDEGVPVDEPILGFTLTSDTSLVNKMLSSQKAKELLPTGIEFRWDLLESFQNFALYAVEARPVVSKDMLNESTSVRNPVVKLKKEYFEKWKIFTSENVGRYVSTSIDGQVFSWPKIAGEVGDGSIYQPQGSFITDKVWSYVLPTLLTDILKVDLKIQQIKFVEKIE